MKVEYIKIRNNKKLLILLIILLVLVFCYYVVSHFEAKTVLNSNVEVKNMIKNYRFALGGNTCGIKLLATGVLVIEVDNKDTSLAVGDVILKLDDTKIDSNKELIEYINTNEVIQNKIVKVTYERDKKIKTVDIKPIYNDESKKYELGLWVKDSSAGVGIVTFYELNNKYFAGLGHGITETSKNVVLPIKNGAIVRSKITSINKGLPKEPGELRGTIYKDVYGQIKKNTVNGIYGVLEDDSLLNNLKEIKIKEKTEIKQGKAKLYCTLTDDEPKSYDILIKNIILNSSGNKNMVIEVVDKKLLEKTGGIVQGMSGSPIVQDGKLIGAVTHVFLNDPTKGYAVFIENMIKDMENIE